MKVTLFIPTLNEISGLKNIIPRIKKEWVDEIIVVDGNSTDGTVEYFESQGYTVLQQKEPGTINAWWQGFDAATGDVIIPFSPDGNSIPEDIPKLVDKIGEGFDMVIASRYKNNARSYDDNWFTAFGNKMFTEVVNVLFHANYTDTLVMYRAFRKELLNTLGFNNQKRELLFEILISIRCAKLKLNIAEIPSSEPKRIGPGESRAHPGYYYKIKSGFIILYLIVRDYLIR